MTPLWFLLDISGEFRDDNFDEKMEFSPQGHLVPVAKLGYSCHYSTSYDKFGMPLKPTSILLFNVRLQRRMRFDECWQA